MISGKIIRKRKIEYISIEKIVTGKFTVRKHFDREKISQLAESVKNFGILQPVTVRKIGKNYDLISGERRLMAAKEAGLVKVPAMVVDVRFDVAAAMAIAENHQREELCLMEMAESYMSLIRRRGLTYGEMADMAGITAGQVSDRVEILHLPRKVRDVLSKYDLSKEHIDAVAPLKTEEAAWLLNEAAEKGYSSYVLADKVKSLLAEKTVKKQVVKDVKIYINTINQAVEKIRKSGVFANVEKTENGQITEYVIRFEQ